MKAIRTTLVLAFSASVITGVAVAVVSAHPSSRTESAYRGGATPRDTTALLSGEYTYAGALAAGLTTREEWAKPKGMPSCRPLPDPFPNVAENASIGVNPPTCYRPPDEQGLIFLQAKPHIPVSFRFVLEPDVGYGLLSNRHSSESRNP